MELLLYIYGQRETITIATLPYHYAQASTLARLHRTHVAILWLCTTIMPTNNQYKQVRLSSAL